MFDFVKKLFSKERKSALSEKNVNTARIIIDEEGVSVRRLNGKVEEINWDDIGEISIITTSDGPFMDDVYLCLASVDGKTGCAIPSTADGYNEVYDLVSKFTGFNFQKYIESMSCTTDAKFVLWEK